MSTLASIWSTLASVSYILASMSSSVARRGWSPAGGQHMGRGAGGEALLVCPEVSPREAIQGREASLRPD